MREIRVGLLGLGQVGQAVVRGVKQKAPRLAEVGVHARCSMALVRDVGRTRNGEDVSVTADPELWRQQRFDVVVEVLGGVEPARTLVADVLQTGTPVVTANKSLVAAHGCELEQIATAHGTVFSFEAAVLAGVPCVNSLARRPLASGTGVWAGIINGTSNYILTSMSRGRTFDHALVEAVARGYAEPTSDADVSGRDAAEKLAILLHLAGYRDVAASDFPRRGLAQLQPSHFSLARRLGGVIKPVALADVGTEGGAWVGPAFVPATHPFATIDDVTNVLSVGNGDATVWFSGPGAGPDVTAATVIDDVVEAILKTSGRPARGVVSSRSVASELRSIKRGSWFLSLKSLLVSDAEVAEFLAGHHLPVVRLEREGSRLGALTATASPAVLLSVIDALEATGVHAEWWPVLPVSPVVEVARV